MTDDARRVPARSRRLLQLVMVLALLGGVSVLSACGSDNKSSSTSSGTSSQATNAPKGTPIVAYTFADVNTQGPQYKNIAETARVYGEWVNAHGGIKGHPLTVKFCDAKGTPTDATACARKAVADKA